MIQPIFDDNRLVCEMSDTDSEFTFCLYYTRDETKETDRSYILAKFHNGTKTLLEQIEIPTCMIPMIGKKLIDITFNFKLLL